MRPRSPLPPPLRGRPFTVAEGRSAGLSESRLRERDLRAPFSGVRVPAALPDDLPHLCRAAALVLPPGSAFSGPTALALLGLPTPWLRRGVPAPQQVPGVGPLHVAVCEGARRPRITGVLVRSSRTPAGYEPTTRRGVLVLQPQDLWAERCAVLGRGDAVALGDAVRRTRSEAQLRVAAEALPDLTERVRALELLALVRPGVESPLETLVRLALLDAGLPSPHPTCGTGVPLGDHPVAWPDLSWPRWRVAVEVDGLTHTAGPQRQRDAERERALGEIGWTVEVVTSRDALHLSRVVDRVAKALWEAGARW